jgi:restriction system protein
MIQRPPADWQELQRAVAQILTEAGVGATVDQVANTVRGPVNIDVLAVDDAATPVQQYFVECKHWRRRVPRTVVHAFRTVVADSGANWGAIVTLRGFQPGAVEAARCSNVRLLTWSGFEALFARRWFSRHFLKVIAEVTDPFLDYKESNRRIARTASALGAKRQRHYRHLIQKYEALFAVCTILRAHSMLSRSRFSSDPERNDLLMFPEPPLRRALSKLVAVTPVTRDILTASHFRDLLVAIDRAVSGALLEFDSLFGERVRR